METYLFTYSPSGLTITPTFKYQDDIEKFFKPWYRCMKEFEINPEFNSSGNLHYHGYYIIHDKIKWFKHVLPRLKHHGFIKIDKVTKDFDKAIVYCRKDRETMQKVLQGLPVPYTNNHFKMHSEVPQTPSFYVELLDEL